MVITCEKCSTRFNLNESLLKTEGSKVRCCKCRHIFMAYPPPQPELISAEPSSDPAPSVETAEKPAEDMKIRHDELSMESQEMELDFQDDELSMESQEMELDFQDDELSMESQEMELDFQDDELSMESQGLELDFQDDELSMDGDKGLSIDNGLDLDLDIDLNLETGENLEPEPGVTDLEEDDFAIDDNSIEIELGDEELDDPGKKLEIQFEDDFSQDSNEIMEDGLELELGDDLQFDDFQDKEDVKKKAHQDLDLLQFEQALDEDAIIDEDDEFDLELELNIPSDEDDMTEESPAQEPLEADLNFAEFEEVLEEEEPPGEMVGLESDPFLEEAETAGAVTDEGAYQQDTMAAAGKEKPTETDGASKSSLLQTQAPIMDTLPKREKRKGVGKPVLALLFITLLLVGGYSFTVMQGIEIPYLSNISIPYLDKFIKHPPVEEPRITLAPDKKSVNGRFVTNSQAGTLFVITGEIKNLSPVPCSKIQVKGTLITKDKAKASEKVVYAGNIITEKELSTLEMPRLDALLARPAGNNNANTNLAGGRSIPFMIVFSNLPDNLENFTVNVDQFEPMDKK